MKSASPVIEVPATPEYVLDVLLEQSKQEWCKLSCTPSDAVPVTLDSPVEVLYEACGFDDYLDLFYEPLEWFPLNGDEWDRVLETAILETARDFCMLIAACVTMPKIPLYSIGGQTCQPASVFLTIRSLLQEAGVDVREIVPSTSLKEYTRHYTETFLGPIARLAPGALPAVKIDDGGKSLRQFIRDIWGIPVLIAFFNKSTYPGLFAFALLSYLFLILITVGDEKAPNARVDFGELRTFRDLSELIAGRAVFQPRMS